MLKNKVDVAEVTDLIRRFYGLEPGAPPKVAEVAALVAEGFASAEPDHRRALVAWFWGIVTGAASAASPRSAPPRLGEVGDVIQIRAGAWSWGRALAIVTEVEAEGVRAVIPSIHPGLGVVAMPVSHAPIPFEAFTVIGRAADRDVKLLS